MRVAWLPMRPETLKGHLDGMLLAALEPGPRHGYAIMEVLRAGSGGQFDLDRKSVVEGKSVDFGGRRIIKKKKKKTRTERVQRKRVWGLVTCTCAGSRVSRLQKGAAISNQKRQSFSPVRFLFFFFSSRRRHTRLQGDWSSDVCSSDLGRSPRRAAQTRAECGDPA